MKSISQFKVKPVGPLPKGLFLKVIILDILLVYLLKSGAQLVRSSELRLGGEPAKHSKQRGVTVESTGDHGVKSSQE